jgi:ubiquinone/menaquinone biosynthesis C-methylase UbiE
LEDKAGFFDRYAAQWAARGYSAQEAQQIRALISRAGASLGMRVLEPGCGPGLVTCLLAEAVGESGHVCALDISPEMVRQCRAMTEGFPQVRATKCAVEDFAGEDNSFDLVFCFNAFPHFSNHPLALRAAHNCLKPGGCIVIAHSSSRGHVNTVHAQAGGPIEHDLLPAPEVLQAMLAKAGFAPQELDDGAQSFFLRALKP